jgi:16S rRNA G966 N2-methylase RsmD
LRREIAGQAPRLNELAGARHICETDAMEENLLYYGDNLDILRRYVEDESVDLIYLDPPFKYRRLTIEFL